MCVHAVFSLRRSSSKPYEVSKTKSSVLYSKQKNGDQVFVGVGINKGKSNYFKRCNYAFYNK